MAPSGTEVMIIALLGGLVPALIWLGLFLNEDRLHPEPRLLIFITFVLGMFIVLPTLEIEKALVAWLGVERPLMAWAFVEELLKYLAALIAVLWRKEVDEPIDLIIYLVTAALGFAAAETTLFILRALEGGDVALGLLTSSYRFVGAALLHTLASGLVGAFLAFAFYKPWGMRVLYLCTGLILATLLHAAFNFFIITSLGIHASLVFFCVWVGVIGLFLLFEKAKGIRAR